MKGITPIVAVILLMLITISMVGFAFVWFSRISTISTEKIENQTEKLLTVKTVRIENALGTAVDIRNTGDAQITSADLAAFVNNVRVTISSCNPSPVPVNSLSTCTLASACSTGATLRISSPGGADTTTCK